MFGSKVRYGISFKTNQKSFDIWSRKYEHSFNANVVKKNLDGAIGLPIETMDAFLVGRGNEVKFYNVDTYQEIEEALITIPLIPSKTREAAEIIGMQKSKNEEVLAIISGKNLVMAEQFANQLFIYRRVKGGSGEVDTFQFDQKYVLKDMAGFEKFSMQFHFKNESSNGIDQTTLIFAKQDKVFEFNYGNG